MRLTILLLLFPIFLTAQADPEVRIIEGTVRDASTGEAIAYANVGIPKYGIGTSSGGRGQFSLKLPAQMVDAPLEITAIGYKTFAINTAKVNGPLRVTLDPASYDIATFTFTGQDPIDIVREAARRIPQNYPNYATDGTAFYRESRIDSMGNYKYLAEGVLNVYKGTYEKSKFYDVGLVQGRKVNLEDPLDTDVQSSFSSGHLAPHRFDVVKNREDFLRPKFMELYDYEIADVVSIYDRPVYVISFEPNAEGRVQSVKKRFRRSPGTDDTGRSLIWEFGDIKVRPRMRGKLYIDKDNYAILRAEFDMLPEILKKEWDGYPLYKGSWGANHYETNYRPLGNGRYYFSNAVREGRYGRQENLGLYVNEVWMTEISPERGDQVPYQQRLGRGDKFVNITGSYDPDFWRNYNSIPQSDALNDNLVQAQNAAAAARALDPDYLDELQDQRDSIAAVEAARRAAELARLEAVRDSLIAAGIDPVESEEVEEVEDEISDWQAEEARRAMRAMEVVRKVRMNQWQGHLTAGTYLLESPAARLGIDYLSEDLSQPIFSLDRQLAAQERDYIWHLGNRIVSNRRWIYDIEMGRNFTGNFYRNFSLGLGRQFNLSRTRPVYLKFIGRVNRLRYARRVAERFDNPVDRFDFRKKRINSNRFDVFYGTRNFQGQILAEFSIELDRGREIFIRGGYHFPFAERPDVWIRERAFFGKKERLSADDDRLRIFLDDQPVNAPQLINSGTWLVTVGYLVK